MKIDMGFKLIAATVVALAGLSPLAAAQAPLEYGYSFFKERVPITLDPSRLAVFVSDDAPVDPGARAGQRAELAQALAPFGVGVRADQGDLGRRGWTSVFSGVGARGADAQQLETEQLVANIAAADAVDFVSPVFMDDHGPRIVTQDILIGFDPKLSHAEADALVARWGVGEIVARDYENQPNMYRVRSGSRNGFEVLAQANDLAQRPEVLFAEPDMIFSVTQYLIPNDPLFGSLWGLRQASDIDMDADEAWDITIGVPSITIAVFDTGTESSHPDLNAQLGFDATGQNSFGEPVTSCDNHGTQVAGCITARINNSQGTVGIAPGCISRGVKTLTIPSQAPCGISGSGGNFISAINWAQTNGVRVTNASLGFGASASIDTAYTNARNAGLVHFAATGNDGASSIGYPSSSPSVNSVGAISQSGNRASFSNFGTGIDFVAPGVSIVTTDRAGAPGDSSGNTVTTSGTSFASPYAAGVAALILSKNPFLTPAQVETIMQTTAQDRGTAGYDTTFGFGLVNARAALVATPDPGPPQNFSVIAPANGATQLVRLPTFTWQISNFSTNYQFQLDDNADFSSPILDFNTTLTSFEMTGTPLNAATTYFWRVNSSNSLGTNTSMPTPASFTTYTIAPGSFNLSTPADGATAQPLQPALTWTTANLAESYTVTIDNNSDFSSPVAQETVTNFSFTPGSPLAPSTQYFWRVQANNLIGSTFATPASRTFTTASNPPNAFNHLSPPDGQVIPSFTPTLDWSDSGGAITYNLRVDDDILFGSPAVNLTGLTNSTFTIGSGVLQNSTRYYWQATAVNPVGQTVGTPAIVSFVVLVNNVCQGDASRDGFVNFADITAVLANLGLTGPLGDANYDGAVNFADVTAVLANLGSPCPG